MNSITGIDKWKFPRGVGTHTLMNGEGILIVNPDETDEFFQSYVDSVNSGIKLYVVEQKTTAFKFFIDLDYKSDVKLTDEEIMQFCIQINEIIPGRCLIAKARPRPIMSENVKKIKSGVHIHFPDLIVNKSEAMKLRSKVIDTLGEGLWDKIIDPAVYGPSGLRMLWSHKYPAGDPYIPWKEVGKDAVFSKVCNVETIKLFSIKTDEVFKPVQQTNVASIHSIEEFINNNIKGHETTVVKRVQRHEYNGWYIGTDSRYCENIRAKHKSNHVWFSIHSGLISQKCFDENCSEFRGREYLLPPSLVSNLNEVDIVGSPTSTILMDLFPNGSDQSFQEISDYDPSIFGTGSGELDEILNKHE